MRFSIIKEKKVISDAFYAPWTMSFTMKLVNSSPDMVTMSKKKKKKKRLKILASQTNKVCKICLEVCTFIKKFVWTFVGSLLLCSSKTLFWKQANYLINVKKVIFSQKPYLTY